MLVFFVLVFVFFHPVNTALRNSSKKNVNVHALGRFFFIFMAAKENYQH